MRRAALAVVLLLMAGCQPASSRTLTSHTLASGRSYQLFDWPRAAAAAKPLVVFLPGLGQSTADARASMPGVEAAAERHGFVLSWAEALPTAASDHAWNAGFCCAGQTADDVTYLRELVSDVALHTPVDLTRVYVWGFSNGGMMAVAAVCEPDTVFAAAGTVAGPWLGTACHRPIWRHLHGAADPIVPLAGGVPAGIPPFGVPADWCGCTFPDSRTEPARVGGFTSVAVDPDASHTWPKTDDTTWRIDGAEDLWANTSPFSLARVGGP